MKRMARWQRVVVAVVLQAWIAPQVAIARGPAIADAIYHGGDVVTVNDAQPAAEAVAIKDGKILAVGKDASVLKMRGPETLVIDLAGKTLTPGFLDGHSHFINSLQVAAQANVFSPPAGPVRNIRELVAQLKRLQESQRVPPGGFLVAYGYDGDMLEDGRDLTADDLDIDFPNNPVIVQHISLHGAVLNSAALKKYQIGPETPTPPGGLIARKPGSNEPAGLVMETAFLPIFARMPKPGPEVMLERLKLGQEIYAAAGITTAQEGATHIGDLELLQAGAAQGLLFLDVVAYPFITDAKEALRKNPPNTFGVYRNHLKLGGVKITADGSPQAKTAYFTTPYLTGGPTGESGWRGEPTFPQAELNEMVKFVYDQQVQLLIHCNGDAAIDSFLKAHEFAAGVGRAVDRRSIVVHSQFVRPDQLRKFVDYKLTPSFYTEHTFFFGEAHIKNRGREQTFFLSPIKTALALGLRPANHTDFNVAPIDQLFVMWTAVNRVSRDGEVIGPDERVTPLQALKAITIDGARMYSEDAIKGSIEPGKLADLVILDKNPLKVPPIQIKDIHVVQTIKEGRTVYKAP